MISTKVAGLASSRVSVLKAMRLQRHTASWSSLFLIRVFKQ